jgi:hypothetical protein
MSVELISRGWPSPIHFLNVGERTISEAPDDPGINGRNVMLLSLG